MKTARQRGAGQRRRRLSKQRGIAAFAAYTLALSTVVFGALPVTPADAAPGDGLCYLIADSGGGNGGNDLLTLVDRGDFNVATNETNIGTGTGTFNIEAMDMHPGTLQLYGANANRLGTIDKLTGIYAPLPNTFGNADGALGTISITDVDGLAFDYNTAVLWGAERQSANDLLVQIDVATGLIVQDAFGPGTDYLTTNIDLLGHDDIDDLAFHPQTGVLYASITGGGGGRLVTLDTATGDATDIGPFGAGDIEGMRFDSEGFLWGTSGQAPLALYEIDINTGAALNPRPLDNGSDYESTVCYVPGSDLQVSKTVDNATPVEGATIIYTVQVFDAGPADATGVIVEDLLPAGVTYVSHSPSQGSYDETTGVWTVGSILRRATATLDMTVTVDIGTAGSTITNTATAVAVDQGDAVPNNDVGSVDVFPNVYADLEVAKVVSTASPGEGDTITYTVTVVNNGPNDTTGVTVDDMLPAGLTFVSSSPSQGTYSSGAGIWTLASLASGAMATLDITATVNAGTALSTITNTASIGSTDVSDPDPSNDSGPANLVVSLAGLEITKSSDVVGPVVPGQTITYTLDITNTGTSLLDGISVTDVVPTGTTFVSGSTQVTGFPGGTYLDQFNSRWYSNSDADVWATSWSETGETTSATGGDIQVLNDISNYQLRIRDRNNSIQRSADLAGATTATVSFDFRRHSLDNSNEIVYFEVADDPSGPWRELARFVGPATDGSYGNTGALLVLPSEMTIDTTFRFRTSSSMRNGDLLWVDDFQADFASAAAGPGHDAPGLVVPADGYVLPAGQTMQVTFEVVADTILTVASIDNTATVDAAGAIPATDGVTDPVAQADLSLTKTVDDPAPNPGDSVDFTITVTNDGPSDAVLIEVTDLLPAGVSYVSDNGGGDYDDASGVWSVGSLAATGSATLVITATVESGTAGITITNSSAITQIDRPDPDTSNNTSSASITIPSVDLEVNKVVDDATPNVGDTIVFSVTVSNNGPDTATAVSLDDVLPAGVTYVSHIAGQGTYAAGTGVWTVGSVAASAFATLDLTVTVDAGTFGTTITNTAAVSGVDETDTDAGNDSDFATVTVRHNPALQVIKTGPAAAAIGDTVTYTFTLSHTGASDLSPVSIGSVVDDVAGPAGYVSGDANGNSLLDGGETWVLDATHTVTSSDPDPIANTVTVTATDQDGDSLPDATDSHVTDVEHLPILTLLKSGPVSALIGDTVTYTFSVFHRAVSDGTPVSGVTVTDDVAGAATYVVGDDGDGLLEAGETWIFTAGYTISATDPDPLVNTGTATGTDLDGDPITASGAHSTVVITPASVGDLIWHDLNADGVADAGEPGLVGVTVNLRDGSGTIIASTVTVGGGGYSFTGLTPGTYTVDIDESTLPLGAPILSTGNEPFPVTLAEGEARTGADFGYYQLATLGDLVWDDLNGDGIQDPGEPGIAGVTVQVFDPGDLATPLYTATTLGDGSYSVSVVPGNYVLEFSLPAGYTFTAVDAGADDSLDSDTAPGTGLTGTVTVTSGEAATTIDAGAYRPVTIGELVWGDLDADGVIDAGEPGIGGVTVEVFDATGTLAGTAVTAADGSYSVTLPPGIYDAVVDVTTLPAGYVLTTPGTVTTPQLDSGDTFGRADFGAVIPTYPISGTVWNDVNVDTVIDGTEPLLGGVTVQLLDGSGAVVATATTAPDGTYSFSPVPDGGYTVRVDETTIPAGMASTTGNNPEAVTVADAAVTDVDFGYAFSGSVIISKTPDSQQVVTGGTATFTITVTNPGPQTLSNVAVSDPTAPNCDATIGGLAAGASTSYSCTLTGVSADFTNVATVSATDQVGNVVGDSDTGDVDVINPSVAISKTPDLQTILSGDTANFSITVTNTGDVALTNVVVTDALAPSCDTTIASLAVGASSAYSCSLAGIAADVTNTADVVAEHPVGGTVTDSDTADVDVISPAISISKTPDLQTILSGGTATFSITVSNDGDAPLSNVIVTDSLAPNCDAALGSLAVGGSQTYSCTVAGVSADFTNTGAVLADHPAGGTVTDIDTADVDVIAPAITISKTPDLQTVLSGDTATFSITVTNTGDAVLSNISVVDPLSPDCDASFASLAVGASESYSCTLPGVAADFTNVAVVSADHPAAGLVTDSDVADVDVIAPAITLAKTPDLQTLRSGDTATFSITVTNSGDAVLTDVAVIDALAPDCDATFGSLAVGASESYTCTLAGVLADFTNTADVTADHAAGGTVTDSDTADVDVIAPAITLAKTPDLQTLRSGDTATFSITVTNTGDAALTDVAVTDALAPACDAVVGDLAVGASSSYSCTLSGVAADLTNIAVVTGSHAAGGTVTDSDTADVDVVAPSIAITQDPAAQQVLAGGTATFTITVTNTGDVGLTNVAVTDALTPGCDASFGSLAIGATETYTCTLADVAADFTNTADVIADHPAGGTVTDSDTADVDVVGPEISISKTPDLQTLLSGDTASFSITVTNTGDVGLTNLVVTDALAPNCDASVASLASGASETYACTLAGVAADFTNTADVVADHPAGGTVTDSDTADVDVVGPGITIEKTPDTQQILAGGDATFTITVTNTGDAELSNVAVTDAVAPACDASFVSLAVGAVETYTCTLAGVAADFTNTAVVLADHPAGGTVTDRDTADVDVIDPGLTISKTPDLQQILAGGTATFNISATNTGDVALNNVAVTDALAPDCSAARGTLAAGASTSYSCTLSGVAGDFTNTAVVSADHPAGGTVGDFDTADVDVIAPAITITKDPTVRQILAGTDATFTITVANTGDVDLSNVAVTDALTPACDGVIGGLAIGASSSYSCTLSGVAADMTNTAVVAADHAAGGSVTDSDSADVDVVTPAITIDKTPELQQVLSGGSVTFAITVTNTGDIGLTNIMVTDALAPNCDATFASLAASASETYSCTLTGVAADFTNTAAITADHPAGGSVSDSDTADVDVVAPAIELAKDPALQQILSGQDATFTITVTNTGDTPLTDITISDPLAPSCDTTIPALGIGGSSSVTCPATGVTSGFTNTASVVAAHGAGGTVTDSDTADVEILVPAVDIQKTPDLQIIESGGTANFTITVTNAGTIPLSNVTVTDPLAPACDTTIGALAVGASTSFTCSLAGVTADFTNTATVNATDAAGNPAADSDIAGIDVIVPAISVSKTPDGQTVVVTGTVTFTIDVTNIGDAALTNVAVTDALAPNCDATFVSLAVGASESFTCTLAGVGADFTNTAAVVADHPAGGTVTDSDTADVTVLVPGVDIQKTPDTQLVGPGGTATFTITVANTGATALTDVVVADPVAPSCDATFASLGVGVVETYTCTVAGVIADFTNTADVTANDPLLNPVTDSDTADVDLVDPAITLSKTPDLQTLLTGADATFSITVTNTGDTALTNVVVTDPLAPGCDTTFLALAIGESQTVGCTGTGVVADFTNVASVVADTPLGTTVSDSDGALVDVVAPGVDIQKTPDLQQVHAGDDVVFTITITNTGDQSLADLTVTDAVAPACDTTTASLAIGASTSYSCTLPGVAADLTNIASVAGTDALGNPISDSDDAAVDVIAPAISISKSPDAQAVVSGGVATFSIDVTNTGDVDLVGVTVTDPAVPACDAVIGSLAAGASRSYTCTLAAVTTGFTNTASVVGTDPIGLDVTGSDTADVTVLVPGIDIQKTPDLQQVRAGESATFTITVTNAGATDLTGVDVTDALVPNCDAAIGDLAVGAATLYTCTLSGVSADFTNTADVTGDDPLGNPVTDSDTADVDVIAPAISISKSPDGQTVVSGGTATFTIVVTNTGDTDLAAISVTDPLVPACDAAVGALAVGASTSYTCTVSGVTADFTNTASVVGTDPLGLTVTDADTADVTVLVPGIDIQKTPDTQTVVEGGTATFTIIVTNIGTTDLAGVTVTDLLAPACDATIGDLPLGSAPVTYTCDVTATASFTNTASVVADDPLGNPLADADSADVIVRLRSTIAGTIAHDIAGDGTIDAGDPGLSGIDVTATWAGLDGVLGTADDEVFVVQTDAAGGYGFDLVPPGNYQIVVDRTDLPVGMDFQTLDPDPILDDATDLILPEDTSVTGVDFAYTATGSIGDMVFFDLDGNGTQESGEPGLGNIDVTITWHGPDGVLGTADDLVFTTATAPDGTYVVNGLPAGDFTVVIDSTDVSPGLSGDIDKTVTLGPAEGRDDVDFPLVGSGAIGDQVFEDLNHDGLYDAGEPGVPGVTVILTWAGPDGTIGTADDLTFTTTTDSNGRYVFDLLPTGDYLVTLDEPTIPAELGVAPPVTLTLAGSGTDMTADFPLVGNRPPIALDDSSVTDEDTPVTISVLGDDSDPDGHDFAIGDTTDPANGTITVNADGTITYTPNPGFTGTDTFTYTICEIDGLSPSGIPATGLCDAATVTVVVNDVNEPPGPDASFQTTVVGDPVDPIPVSDPEGGPVTVTFVSGELPPGVALNPDGTFSGVTTEVRVYVVIVEVCDSGDPQMCIEHTHTIAVTPQILPGPGDDPDLDDPPDTLPFTGANFGELLWIAMMMLLTGAGLVLFSRRHEET